MASPSGLYHHKVTSKKSKSAVHYIDFHHCCLINCCFLTATSLWRSRQLSAYVQHGRSSVDDRIIDRRQHGRLNKIQHPWQRHFWSLCERDSISVLKKYAYTKHRKVPWIFHIATWVIRKHHQTKVLVLLRRSSLVRDQADLISWRPCLWAY